MYQNRSWLYQKYVVGELPYWAIGLICGVSALTIRYFLKKYGIKIRTRSEALIGRKRPEISGEWQLEDEKKMAKIKAGRDYCDGENIKFSIWAEEELGIE